MERKIEIIKATPEHLERINEIMIKAWTPIRALSESILGPELIKTRDGNWKENQFATIKGRVEAGCGIVALVDGKIAGFATYRDVEEIPFMGQLGYNAVDTDFKGMGLGTMMYNVLLDKMREEGKKYARVHTNLDSAHAPARRSYQKAGLTRAIPEILYHMELSKRPEQKINKDIQIVPVTEEHIEEIKKIVVAAWTPIRKVQRETLGDEIYNLMFNNWEEKKCNGVINAALGGAGYNGYVAILDGKVAGVVTYRVIDGEVKLGRIGNNAVNPEFGGRGIGSTLYKYVLDKMEASGLKYASVLTGLDEGHAPARRAYEKAGFDRNLALETVLYYMYL